MPRLYKPLQDHPLRLLIAAWLIAWITAVPLFHVHIPDTTDHWSVLQSGGPHTVFTPALPGEFSHPFHDHVGHVSQRAVNSAELGFAVVNNKSEDEKVKPIYILSASCHVANGLRISWPFECSGTFRAPAASYTSPAFRAPPRVGFA